jgi:hypothetical protein
MRMFIAVFVVAFALASAVFLRSGLTTQSYRFDTGTTRMIPGCGSYSNPCWPGGPPQSQLVEVYATGHRRASWQVAVLVALAGIGAGAGLAFRRSGPQRDEAARHSADSQPNVDVLA